MHKLVALLALALGSVSASAAPASLCESSEKVFFSCSLGKKLISVCGANDPSSPYLKYRAGQLGREPELVFPKESRAPQSAFRFGAEGRSAKGGIWNLAFQNNEYIYTIYRFRHSFEPMSAGVAVKSANGKARYFGCNESTVIDNLSSVETFGLPGIESKAIVDGPE